MGSNLADLSGERHPAAHDPDWVARQNLDDLLVLNENGIQSQVNADLCSNFLDILASRVVLIFTQLGGGMGHEGMVGVDSFQRR